MKFIKIVFIWFFIGCTFSVQAQPFSDEIAAFKLQDSENGYSKNSILFVGSSSFRMWNAINKDFPGYNIINRGFGGSSLPDVIRYAEDIIFPYLPKQVIIYCGENDIASSDTVTSEMVRDRFKILFSLIRNKIPDVPIVFVSIKPSPSRWEMKDRMIKANKLIKKYLDKQKEAKFVNVWKAMLGPDSKPMPAIFIEDNLHMNAKGYAIWQKIIKPYLAK